MITPALKWPAEAIFSALAGALSMICHMWSLMRPGRYSSMPQFAAWCASSS